LLADPAGQLVQFVLLPYPTPTRYLKDEKARYSSLDEKNQLLHESLLQDLSRIRERFVDPRLPSVLAAHIHVRGSQLHNLYRLSEREDVTFDPADIPTQWSYVALGHIHKPQALPGAPHVRYSGSIERFDLAEREDEKGAVLVEVGPQGRIGDPVVLPLDATPIYQVEVRDPVSEIATLSARYPDASRALVAYWLFYRPGEHNRDECVRQIEEVFPRCYHRELVAEGAEVPGGVSIQPGAKRDVPGTVLGYVRERLAEHADRDAVLALAEEYLANQEVER
jgi:exonuclease SbcD